MRILILNWKDIRHPQAGGAETATHHYAKHLLKLGHVVTIFASRSPNLKAIETVDGVRTIRQGNIYTVRLFACFAYLRTLRKQTDIAIDQIHGIPFLTPLYVRKPKLAFIHEVAGEIWFREFPWALAWIGLVLEKIFLLFYRKTFFIADSQSTGQELAKLGIPRKNIGIIPLTIDRKILQKSQKTVRPSLIYLGRITPMKRIELLLEAAAILVRTFPNIEITIAGTGNPTYMGYLRGLAQENNLTGVNFTGKISEPFKNRLLRRSWLHVHPSLKEGFGLTVLEAAQNGTATIAYKVPGLKDLIKNGVNGILVNQNTVHALAVAIDNLLRNKSKLSHLNASALNWSKSWPTWKEQTQKLERLLQRLLKNPS